MTQEIIHGTKVIVDFLNIEPRYINSSSIPEYDLLGVIEDIQQDEKHFYTVEDMFFHRSYDWLSIPIQKLQAETEDAVELGDLMYGVFFCNKITAFRSVVKYIETHTKKYEVFINGSWDTSFEEVPCVQVYNVGEVRRMSKFELNQFDDKGDYDCYLCPDLFQHPKWNGEIKFIRESKN